LKPGKTPKRRKKTAAARLRPFWILIGFLAALLVAAGAAAVMWPGFSPKTIEVAGNRRVSRDEILARAQVAPNVNMWLQNPRAIATRVEAIPYVGSADVRRVPPATVAIDVTERTPFAILVQGKQAVLVDRDLRVLQPADAATNLVTFALPGSAPLAPGTFVRTDDASALRTLYDELAAAHVAAVRLEYDRFGGAVATLRDGLRVMLGDDVDTAKKIALIEPIVAQVVRKGKPAEAIDLRAPNTPVVVYKN
jgi:cell division protein FtsQ